MENQETKSVVNTTPQVPFYKRMKKSSLITAIVSLSIICVLILTTILLAVIPTYTGVKYENAPDYIVVKTETRQVTLYSDDENTKADFNKIWNAYNSLSSPTIMETIFNGYSGRGKEANYVATSKSYGSLASQNDFVVEFHWDTAQLMTDSKGDKFVYKYSNGDLSTQDILYTTATFAVSSNNAVEEKTFYLRRSTADVNSTSTNFYYTGIANFNQLYQVLKVLQDEGKLKV